ncbi:hypothetical protein J8F10_13560 [Gemmata sp. G18]|uniref:Uncharacterized protein n=1 Tax=Gemmata palustris TaxID=2822762 RepID=A0ABS5BRE5_9BACT|nr:hypothetical protein [Gemmata palustris]MBP3956312.1 hypothetical protein [Gemmata palustris]
MKPWDEMTEEGRVAWHEQLGETSTPGEAGAFVTGLLQNPEALAEFLRVLEKHKAQSLAGEQSNPDAPSN